MRVRRKMNDLEGDLRWRKRGGRRLGIDITISVVSSLRGSHKNLPCQQRRSGLRRTCTLAEKRQTPVFVTPMAALAVDALPEGPEWSYELKLDGYRALIIKDGASIQIRSRNDKDLMPMYPAVAAAGRRLQAEQAVIDGEIVAVDKQGRPSFQALAAPRHPSDSFDRVLCVRSSASEWRGHDSPATEGASGEACSSHREIGTAALACVARQRGGHRQYGPGNAAGRYRRQAQGLLYEAGERSRNWQKLKLERQQEFVIGGYRPSGNNSVDALLVGYFEDRNCDSLPRFARAWCRMSDGNSPESSRACDWITARSLTCRLRVHPAGAAA